MNEIDEATLNGFALGVSVAALIVAIIGAFL